ncbi:MAG: carboxypeptidase regulatory-like domain-containing protein [Planctomycetes bacterium]|nr:carboxypeptidase regulatory-like domain-containing protein [Planctomycetota bacterium]
MKRRVVWSATALGLIGVGLAVWQGFSASRVEPGRAVPGAGVVPAPSSATEARERAEPLPDIDAIRIDDPLARSTPGDGAAVVGATGTRLAIHVTSPLGQPVNGAKVRLYPRALRGPRLLEEFRPENFRAAAVATEVTDGRGDAIWPSGVAADTFVLVEAQGFAPCVGTVTEDETRSGVSNFPLNAAGAIKAQVVDGLNSRPLAGVTVVACANLPYEKEQGDDPALTLRALAAARATTASDGRVEVPGLDATTEHALFLFAAGYPPRKAFPVATLGVEQLIRLYGGTAISGRVVDIAGHGIAGVSAVAAVCGIYPSQEVCRALTAADGTFTVDSAPPTALAWAIRKEGYGLEYRHVLDPPGRVPLEFVLRPAAKYSGLVVDDLGTPIAGARLEFAAEPTMSTIGSFETYDDGSFDMPWLPDQQALIVTAKAAGHVARRLAGVIPENGARIALERVGGVRGRAVDSAGAPVGKYRVGWRSTRLDMIEEFDVTEAIPWRAVAAADGAFELAGVSSGIVELYVDAPGYARPDPIRVTVPPGGTTERLTLALETGRSIQGRLVGADGRPIAYATVSWLMDSLFGEPCGRVTPTTSDTDNDGSFTLHGMPSRPFTLRATDNVHPNTFFTELRVEDFPRDLVYSATAVIEGRIAMAWSSPESAVRVYAHLDGTQTYSITDIDARGRFRFGPIPPGRWLLELHDVWGERIASSYYARLAKRVDAAPGMTTQVEFDVRPRGRIDGRVRAPIDEVGCRRIEVLLYEAPSQSSRADAYCQLASCDSDGRFVLFAIPPGRYLVEVASRILGFGATACQWVEITDSAPTAELQFVFGKAVLKGKVLDGDGRPIAADVVAIDPRDGRRLLFARTEPDGTYALVPPAQEVFALVVSAPGFAEERGEPIDSDSDLSELREHVLEPEARIAFQVRDDAGAPVVDAVVELFDATTRPPASASARFSGRTSFDGSVVVTRLPAGQWRAQARQAGWPPAPPVMIDLEWGETRSATLALTRFGGVLIEVVDTSGAALPLVSVTLYPEGDPGSTRTALCDAAGLIAIEGLPVGRWVVAAESGDRQRFEVVAGEVARLRLVMGR